MKLRLSERAQKDYRKLTPALQARVDKQFGLLLADLRHPSLRAKKYDEASDVWQGRVDRGYRFYFVIRGDTYVIVRIIRHPK